MARTLIERGANVNVVDKLGMTPLLWAASMDFGDPAMIELLLKSGAKADATQQGRPHGARARAQVRPRRSHPRAVAGCGPAK